MQKYILFTLKEIDITIEDNENAKITINNKIDDMELLEKLNKLATLDSNVKINYIDSKVSIIA